MKTTKKWVGRALFLLLLLQACDNKESTELFNEEEINLDSTANSGDASALDEDRITLYKIEGEHIVKMQDYKVDQQLIELQNDTVKHQEIWALVKKIMPTNYRAKLSQFLIYHGAKTKTSAFVDPTINNLSKWQFAIAADYAYKKPFDVEGELTFTIIHELGHILTLNDEQIQAGVIEQNCSNYFVDLGCAKADAFINTFYNRFWEDISEEFDTLEKTPEANLTFYNTYSDHFVSEYAASGPNEDFAEVFATFVTETHIREGSSIADQKVQLMYDFIELTLVRDYIRQNNLLIN